MKIKLAILETDKNYLNRIVTALNTKFSDKFEIYSFTDKNIALDSLNKTKIDVLIVNDSFEIEPSVIPNRCSFAYLVESAGIDTLNGQRTICKFQKADLIYKQILSLYSENAGNLTGFKITDDDCKIIAFASPSGGAGSSTMAAASALYFAQKGKKTLYLNLEFFGSADIFFAAEGQFTMSDVIFALKSKRANLAIKLESSVKQDKRGVYFYSQSQLALDMMEFSTEDSIRLISEVKLLGSYDYIIIDIDFSLDKSHIELFHQVHSIVITGDGSEMSNMKIFRAYNALKTKEQSFDKLISNRMFLVYNKFSNKTSKALEGFDLKSIGGAPRYEHATTEQILSQLSALSFYDKIISL